MTKATASLSLDLDDLWSYMKTHGDPGWSDYPSYLDVVIPRFLALLEEAGLRITVFVVGQDAELERNHDLLRSIADAGHEIGNHSFHHEPWLHLYSASEIEAEIVRAEGAIQNATGATPRGFRGPGYSLSEDVLKTLVRRSYAYDCSTFPTVIGPLARAYYFFRARLDTDQKEKRTALFGQVKDGFRPLKPYRWKLGKAELTEVPVTTLPGLRIPIHYSYIHWLAGFSDRLASTYHTTSLRTCRLAGIEPSLLLHPLDFLGKDDVEQLSFFPGMDQSATEKVERMQRLLASLAEDWEVKTVGDHAAELTGAGLPLRKPDVAVPSNGPEHKGAEAEQ